MRAADRAEGSASYNVQISKFCFLAASFPGQFQQACSSQARASSHQTITLILISCKISSMTIKQAVARPAELSQEFVQDSEGEESERGDNVTSEAIGVVQKNKRPANKSTSNGTEVTPAQESEAASDSESSGSSQASSTSENGRGESDGGQSTASDDSRKRSRPSEISQPSKKQKKR